jgi:hypothetical protein
MEIQIHYDFHQADLTVYKSKLKQSIPTMFYHAARSNSTNEIRKKCLQMVSYIQSMPTGAKAKIAISFCLFFHTRTWTYPIFKAKKDQFVDLFFHG